jgi:hypothetical protein
MVRLTGVCAVKLPDLPPAEVPTEQVSVQETNTCWFGLAVTVTVIVTGSVAVPEASQMAKSPCALHEPKPVPALAAVAVVVMMPAAKAAVMNMDAVRLGGLIAGSFLACGR